MRADAFALDGQQRRGRFPRRLNHQTRGLARLVAFALGNEIDAVVVVARPRGVAGAERIKGQPRDRFVRAIPGDCAQHVRAAGLQRNRQRHRLGRRRDVERSGLDFPALDVPRVEAVAFGAPDAVVLDFDERQVHVHAADGASVEADRDDRRADAVFLFDEPRRPPQSDVPRRRMDDESRAAGDVLARDVFDVALERVAVRHAVARLGLEIERQLPVGAGRPRPGRDL